MAGINTVILTHDPRQRPGVVAALLERLGQPAQPELEGRREFKLVEAVSDEEAARFAGVAAEFGFGARIIERTGINYSRPAVEGSILRWMLIGLAMAGGLAVLQPDELVLGAGIALIALMSFLMFSRERRAARLELAIPTVRLPDSEPMGALEEARRSLRQLREALSEAPVAARLDLEDLAANLEREVQSLAVFPQHAEAGLGELEARLEHATVDERAALERALEAADRSEARRVERIGRLIAIRHAALNALDAVQGVEQTGAVEALEERADALRRARQALKQ